MTEHINVWRVSVRVPISARLAIEEMLQTCCLAVSTFEADDGVSWSVDGFTTMKPDRSAFELALANILHACDCDQVIRVRIDLLPQRDWLAENMASFPPRRVGRYFIVGSHMQARSPASTVRLCLDPGTAFGSGEHGTTAGCLKILDELAKAHKYWRPLDMGCGSGILALAMAKTWRRLVVAIDLDPEAIRVTRMNADKNRIGPLIRAVCATGFRSQAAHQARPYDLIVANIFARPLIAMSADVNRHLQSGNVASGAVVLSGFLERDARWVIAAYKAHGLMFRKIIISDGWATLLLTR